MLRLAVRKLSRSYRVTLWGTHRLMVNLQEAGRGRTVQPPFAGLLLYWADIALIVVELLILFAIYLHAKSSHREYLWRKVLAVVKTLTATMSFLGRGISYVRNLWSSPEPRGSDPAATPSTEPAEVPPPGDSYAYYPVEQGSQDADRQSDSATSLSAAPNASSPHNRRQHLNNFSPTDTRLKMVMQYAKRWFFFLSNIQSIPPSLPAWRGRGGGGTRGHL